MPGAGAGDSPGGDFSSLRDELRQEPDVLVIHFDVFVGAEPTYLAPEHRPPSRRLAFVTYPIALMS